MRAETPVRVLTRHFADGLFGAGMLTDAGIESYRRLLIGVLSGIFCTGLLLTRVFFGKYAALSVSGDPGASARALAADDMFIIALPMLVVAFVTTLAGRSLFPDETDLRVLGPLPVPRRTIFAGKLAAVVVFGGVFVGGVEIAMAPLLVMTSVIPWSEHGLAARLPAMAAAMTAAGLFTVLATVAVHGALVTCLPPASRRGAATVFRSAMLCLLVLSLPFVARIPTLAGALAVESPLLALVPPAWFLGASRVILGDADPYLARLAALGLAALGIAALASFGSYALLYRRFDREMVDASRVHEWPAMRSGRSRRPVDPAFAAVGYFARVTIVRSPLHQGVFAGLSACGAGLVLNSAISAGLPGWLFAGAAPPPRVVGAVIWMPLALVFVMTLAARAVLVLPVNRAANWVFRMIEQPMVRVDGVRAVERTVFVLGVALPVALLFPVQAAVLGTSAIASTGMAALLGALLVQALLTGWDRLPFTCSYLPGKRNAALMTLVGLTSFVLFTVVGHFLARIALSGPMPAIIAGAILTAMTLALRRLRLRRSLATPLVFEDVAADRILSLLDAE